MIKVLHFVSSLSINSGLMSVIMNYYRKINREKVQFGFMFFKNLSEGTYSAEIKELGGDVIYFDLEKTHMYRAIESAFSGLVDKYDILQIHELYLAFAVNNIARKHDINIIIGHAHTIKFSESFVSGLRNRILCLGINKACDYKMACSKEAGKLFFGKEVFSDRFTILNNAIDVQKYRFRQDKREELRNSLGYKNSDVVIGHVGRFAHPKNHLFLVEIFSYIVKRNSKYKLMLVGEGSLESEVRAVVENKKLSENVKFLGRREDVNLLYSAMDVFLFPSLYEGLGNALIEAQANGLACVASSAIPQQARILSSYKVLSLEKDAEYWAKEVVNLETFRNDNCCELLTAKGYNIEIEGQLLEEKYQSMIERVDNARKRNR